MGVMLAGADDALGVGFDECVRITTGAPLPVGADTVVIKEARPASTAISSLSPKENPPVRTCDWPAKISLLAKSLRVQAKC